MIVVALWIFGVFYCLPRALHILHFISSNFPIFQWILFCTVYSRLVIIDGLSTCFLSIGIRTEPRFLTAPTPFQVRSGSCWRRTRNGRSSTRRRDYGRCTWKSTPTTNTGHGVSRKRCGKRDIRIRYRTLRCRWTPSVQVCHPMHHCFDNNSWLQPTRGRDRAQSGTFDFVE